MSYLWALTAHELLLSYSWRSPRELLMRKTQLLLMSYSWAHDELFMSTRELLMIIHDMGYSWPIHKLFPTTTHEHSWATHEHAWTAHDLLTSYSCNEHACATHEQSWATHEHSQATHEQKHHELLLSWATYSWATHEHSWADHELIMNAHEPSSYSWTRPDRHASMRYYSWVAHSPDMNPWATGWFTWAQRHGNSSCQHP